MTRVYLALSTVLVLACKPSEFDSLLRARTDSGSHAARVPEGDAEAEEPSEPAQSSPQTEPELPDAGSTPDAESMLGGSSVRPQAASVAEAGLEAGPEAGPEAAPEAGPDGKLPEPPEASVPPDVTTPPKEVCLNSPSDTTLCGCASDCDAPNAVASCVAGRCVRTCHPDFDDCNRDLGKGRQGDGCEMDVRADDLNCSSCGQQCTPTPAARFVGCENKLCKPLDIKPMQLRSLGRCLDVRGPSAVSGTPVQIWSCGDKLEQQEWAATPAKELRGYANKCLDVRGPKADNGTVVQIWDCVHAPQQRWTLNERGQLVGLAGKCLQVKDGISADGQDVELWDCADIPAQRWTLVEP